MDLTSLTTCGVNKVAPLDGGASLRLRFALCDGLQYAHDCLRLAFFPHHAVASFSSCVPSTACPPSVIPSALHRFRSAQAEGARLPPWEDLVRAFRTFFSYKLRYNNPLNSTQAFLAVQLLRFLTEPSSEDEHQVLTLEDIRIARDAALKVPKDVSTYHLELSRNLYEEIRKRLLTGPTDAVCQSASASEGIGGEPSVEDFRFYITALTQYGGSVEAASRLAEYWQRLLDDGTMYKGAKALWVLVLRGLAAEGKEGDLMRVAEKAANLGVDYMPMFHRQQWLQSVFQDLCDTNPPKPLWDVIFEWAVLVLRKGVDDVKDMIDTMIRHNQHGKNVKPDTETINGLVRAAIERKDPYLAERFVGLGKDLGIAPDSTTYILQMDYRIDARDFSGARAVYGKLEGAAISNDEDLPVLNKYIRALCAVESPDIERILDITTSIEHRQAALEPETVVELCTLFLKTDQQYEVIDTLSLHTVRLLRQFFPETEPSDRVQLMDAFFDRKRPDMACYIFGHMRAHPNPEQRPTNEVYIRCFEGLGRCPDMESLRMVHNMLKMDTTIQMETRLYNALMLAYATSEDPSRALDFWDEITNSAEGPTYNSLAIIMSVCEKLPFGDRKAREIWNKMQRMDLEVPPFVFTAYCGAIAGQGLLEEVKKLILGMDSGVGYPPNLMTLAVVYNALPGQNLKECFEEWAKEEYPEIWKRLVSKGRKRTAEGLEMFKVSRELKA
ncbi:hypothetical protein VTK73DRAFT_10350 [Phialemonium thermophilum]|uniref:Uncharacterized protein n=1 Tax=Phialemonium thermophilum TaxID=223376 RepID=A0ABR3VX56_9PEZI